MLMPVVASLPRLLARHLQVHLNRVTPVEEMEIESHPIIESISFKEPSGRPVVCSAKIVTLSCSEKIWKLWGAEEWRQLEMYRSCALLLAKASGRPVLPGVDAP
jgi:hypothetical protein